MSKVSTFVHLFSSLDSCLIRTSVPPPIVSVKGNLTLTQPSKLQLGVPSTSIALNANISSEMSIVGFGSLSKIT